MKTKQEVIQEAWGEYYDSIQDELDKDGWLHSAVRPDIDLDLDVELQNNNWIIGESEYIRPKSLQGIEDNNGWIRIESEDDLPKDLVYLYSEYGDIIKGHLFNHYGYYAQPKYITHYQPIIKPKPPIY